MGTILGALDARMDVIVGGGLGPVRAGKAGEHLGLASLGLTLGRGWIDSTISGSVRPDLLQFDASTDLDDDMHRSSGQGGVIGYPKSLESGLVRGGRESSVHNAGQSKEVTLHRHAAQSRPAECPDLLQVDCSTDFTPAERRSRGEGGMAAGQLGFTSSGTRGAEEQIMLNATPPIGTTSQRQSGVAQANLSTPRQIASSFTKKTSKYASVMRNAGDAQARELLERVLECLDSERCETFQDYHMDTLEFFYPT